MSNEKVFDTGDKVIVTDLRRGTQVPGVVERVDDDGKVVVDFGDVGARVLLRIHPSFVRKAGAA